MKTKTDYNDGFIVYMLDTDCYLAFERGQMHDCISHKFARYFTDETFKDAPVQRFISGRRDEKRKWNYNGRPRIYVPEWRPGTYRLLAPGESIHSPSYFD